ncbi:hypothetical protein ADL00_42605 [Streptomyces sp. AS58]|uniref:hypothetical protein n=1 Tax=Streptomyces sp. AS58 TaxID=1519489 RepID=UPI0006ADA03E|nr:hypothetical protein [Streptomyces sp. AS58]KOV50849.1 hypothetical protein ADL00_42605 [Streptomyces sp. AS58]
MTSASKGKHSVSSPLTVRTAVLLAARLFPNRAREDQAAWRHVVDLRDAHFLTTGQMHLWDAWPKLPDADQVRITRMLRQRPMFLASRTVFVDEAAALLTSGEATEFADTEGEYQVLVLASADPEARVDALLDELEHNAAKTSGFPEPAQPGSYVSDLRIRDALSPSGRIVDVVYHLDYKGTPAAAAVHTLGSAPELDEVTIPFAELESIAKRLDERRGQTYRRKAVADIRKYARGQDGAEVGEILRAAAGPLRVFHAPTGMGKNVLSELVALWCAQAGLVMSLVVPQSAQVLACVHRLRQDLNDLGVTAQVTPIISPASMQELAEQAASNPRDEPAYRSWVYREMSYSCPLTAHATVSSTAVDSWSPGQEPCDQLKANGPGKRTTYACPWRGTCGKFRHHRAAATANILVTNHANFLSGHIHTPLRGRPAPGRNMTTEQLLLHRSHLVIIDEVDALQALAFDRAARQVLLARDGTSNTPVRDLDAQFRQHCNRLDMSVEQHLRPLITHLMWLAESYVSHLVGGVIHPDRERRSMVVPRRWDGMIAARIFGLPPGERPSPQQMQAVSQLYRHEGPLEFADTVPGLAELRQLLSSITDLSGGLDRLNHATLKLIEDAFSAITGESDEKRLHPLALFSARRAYLEEMRSILHRIVSVAGPLQGAGISATNDLADAVASHVPWRAAPYGPMGRPLFAFSETFDPADRRQTALHLKSYVGDPHAHIAYLGDVTALAHTGTHRAVIGMSATAYMPYAPRHHILQKPSWYVPDDVNGSLTVQLQPGQDNGASIAVSGTDGEYRERSYEAMGRSIGRDLPPQLDAVAADPETAHRAYALLAPTAYDAGPAIARGMIAAGIAPSQICVAVRSKDMASYERNPPGWIPIPSDRLEQFPYGVGHGRCRYLIAPMARVERGLNIVDSQGRSLLHVACLVNRPVPVMEDPPVLLSVVNSIAYRRHRPGTDPAAELERLRLEAGHTFDDIRSGQGYFKTLGTDVKLAVVAEILTRLIQLGGRTRRGGDPGLLRLLDAAFTDTASHSTLPALLGQLRSEWTERGEMPLIDEIYRTTMTDALLGLAEHASSAMGPDEEQEFPQW